jgi:hypothetical protein
MTKPSRLPSLCVLATILLTAVWLVFSTLVVPPLIESAYRGESLPIFNRIISGQAVHPVTHYLGMWNRITYVGLILILATLVSEEAHVRAWACSHVPLLLAIVIMIHLLPLWTFTYFPSLDGPAHLNIANVIRQYYSPDLPIFREYYILNKNPDPNWSTYFVLVSLMSIVPPLVAEKILLSSYVILLPLSTFYALRAIRPTAGLLTLVVSPFIYNRLLHMGFYNFSYSLVLFFFVLGYWLRYRDRLTHHRILTIAFLSLLLYFCHLVSLVMAYTAILLLALLPVLRELVQQIRGRQVDVSVLRRAFRTQLLPAIYALLPTLILAMMFLARQGITGRSTQSFWYRLQGLLAPSVLTSYDVVEVWCAKALVILFFIVSCSLLVSKVVHRRIEYWDSLLLVAIAYTGIYCIAPNEMAGGGFIGIRLSLYPFFALILWFGGQSLSEMKEWRVAIYVSGIAFMLLGLHTLQYAALNNYLEEYLSGMHLVAPNTTLLSLAFSRHTGPSAAGTPSPFRHASGYIAAQRNIVALEDSHPAAGYFPIIFRPHLNPLLHIAIAKDLRNELPQTDDTDNLDVDFLTYPQRTGGRVDYVLLWDVRPEQRNLEATHAIFAQLQAHYELIYISPQRGLMQLYRWKDEKQEYPHN